MRLIGLVLAAACVAGPLAAQEQTPSECRQNAQGRVDYRACADAAPKGSPARALALINLGTEAAVRQDYPAAVAFYDQAQDENAGKKIFSDASFHAFRAVALDHVGRKEEALTQALTSLEVLKGVQEWRTPPATAEQRKGLLPFILPILKRGADRAAHAEAAELFLAIPPQDWIDYGQRGGILDDLDRHEEAIAAAQESLRLAPDQPPALNNLCYVLTRGGRPAEGLPYCERARAAAPDAAPVRHSYAAVLAALGRCSEAEVEIREARRLAPGDEDYAKALACKPR